MIDIRDYGFTSSLEFEKEYIPARVTAVHRELYEVICCYGETNAKLKSSVYYNELSDELFPTTGDFVLIQYNANGDSLIVKTLERKSKFSRTDFSGHGVGYVKTVLEQVVAANFDYVFIMAALNHDFNIKRIERYLTSAWQSGATPVIVLTKADLADDYSEQIRAVESIAIGVDVFAVSAKTGLGLAELIKYLTPQKTIVFLGSSGVGKSSLVNALAGEDIMKVNNIREDDSKGRHTTTHRQLIKLKSGVMIIDTPGMRELGMWDVSTGLSEAFTDVEDLLSQCKFSDCTHSNEPGCAVNSAIEAGELDESRWQNYLQLKRESRFSDNKAKIAQMKQQKSKVKYKKNSRNSEKNINEQY